MNLAEQWRARVVRDLQGIPSFAVGWPPRRAFILNQLGPPSTWSATGIVNLGDHLSQIFRLGAPGAGAGRTQASLSQAGTVWEALVTYYLNMCYAGTDTIAVRRGQVPRAIADALTVWAGPTPLAADIDAMVLTVPGISLLPTVTSQTALRARIESLVAGMFDQTTVVVLACKTNWNDSVQTPMLWNLLYNVRRSTTYLLGGLSIGSGTYSLDGLKGFSYSFITVPSNAPDRYTSTGAPVQRAKTMVGGHFWGYPTAVHVAPSIREFFSVQAGRVQVAAPGVVGVALASQARSGAGDLDMVAFDLT